MVHIPASAADLPADRRSFALEVVQTLVEAGYTALWAGGCVRDLLLSRTPQDYDVATNATPEQVRGVFGRRRTLAVGESFGVVIVLGRPGAEPIEVATFRTEGPYADGRRPDHVAFATPEADAQRRDFTINGIFLDPLSDRVLDYVGGRADLDAGIVRAIGEPQARMTEDKLRLLRAVRFAATLDFTLDPATATAVQAMAPQILVVSWERIAAELQKMLRHPYRRRAIHLTHELGLLERILPELSPQLEAGAAADWSQTLDHLDALTATRFEPALAILLSSLPSEPKPRGPRGGGAVHNVCQRLRLSTTQREAVEWLTGQRHAFDGAEQFPAARLKRLLAHPLVCDLLAIEESRPAQSAATKASLSFVSKYLQRVPSAEINPPTLVSGDDLIRMGARPGPQFKAWLEEVRDAQLNGELTTRDAALQVLSSLVAAS